MSQLDEGSMTATDHERAAKRVPAALGGCEGLYRRRGGRRVGGPVTVVQEMADGDLRAGEASTREAGLFGQAAGDRSGGGAAHAVGGHGGGVLEGAGGGG